MDYEAKRRNTGSRHRSLRSLSNSLFDPEMDYEAKRRNTGSRRRSLRDTVDLLRRQVFGEVGEDEEIDAVGLR